MKFVVINDIHLGKSKPTKGGVIKTLSHLSESTLNEILSNLKNESDISFMANLGDLATDNTQSEDAENMKRVVSLLSFEKFPTFHIIGNHEQRNLSDEECKEVFGYSELYYSHVIDNVRMVFLHTKESLPNDKINSKIEISDIQLKWLSTELASSKEKVLVFSHHSLADQDVVNNFYFSGKEYRCLVNNRSEVRKVIENSKKVIACINGHLHWNNVTLHNEIPYITLQSLVEDFNSNGIPSATYSVFELDNSCLKVHVMGNDRFEFVKYL